MSFYASTSSYALQLMGDGVFSAHGMIAQFLVVAPNTVGIVYVIILHQNMVGTTVHLTDPLILRLKSVMRIHAPVSKILE